MRVERFEFFLVCREKLIFSHDETLKVFLANPHQEEARQSVPKRILHGYETFRVYPATLLDYNPHLRL
jgi:hypothetical protein